MQLLPKRQSIFPFPIPFFWRDGDFIFCLFPEAPKIAWSHLSFFIILIVQFRYSQVIY